MLQQHSSRALQCLLRGRLRNIVLCRPNNNIINPSRTFVVTSTVRDARHEPWLSATPRVCLHDVPTIIRAGGLQPNTPVTFTADLTDENGKQFCSHAHYVTDAEGQVDVTEASSMGGSYEGVFPAGLLTTLAPAPHEFPLLRLYRRDPQLPWKINIKLTKGHQPLGSQKEVLSKMELERHLMAPGVRRVPLREGRVRATLFLPSGPGPFPGAIDMFGTAGGLMEFRAAMMASRGIATMALAYFAFEDLPKTTEAFDLEYFEEASELLMSQEGVIPDRCGVVGVSKAADIAFTMGTWLPKVKAIVSISGSPVAYDSVITYHGKTLFEGFKMDLSFIQLDEHGRLYPKREMIQLLTPDHPKFIPIERADDDTYFLAVGGKDDAWSCDLPVLSLQQRMEMFGRSDKLKTKLYPGAGHILEPPYGPLIHYSYHRHLPVVSEEGGVERVTGVPILWGGRPLETCHAQEDLWLSMRDFLNRHIRDESPWYQQHFCSHAHYVSDAEGKVDLSVVEAVSGSYSGVFSDGLLTTLSPAPHESPSLRLYRRDPRLPWKINIQILDGHQPRGAQKEAMCKLELERHLMAPGVRRVPVREGKVRGVLYLPPGPGPFPGIVDMFGSVGGLMEFRSAMLASRGFASLALAVFNYDDLPKTTSRIDLDYFEEAVGFLLSHPEAIPDRCGTVAISKSGDIVFSMGTIIPEVKAVVGISSCTMGFHSKFFYKGKFYAKGVEVKFESLRTDENGAIYGDLTPFFDPEHPLMIPVEQADDETHFLVAVGDDDPWGFRESLPAFRQRMLKHNKRNFETILYPGAGHIIEPPYGPLIHASFQRHLPSKQKDERYQRGVTMKWGGRPKPQCEAQVDLWRRMREFFMQHVRDESPWYQKYIHDQLQQRVEK